MMNRVTSIDSWAWIPIDDANEGDVERVRRALTIADNVKGQPVLHRAYVEKDGFIGVPRGFFAEEGGLSGHVSWKSSMGLNWPFRMESREGVTWPDSRSSDKKSLTISQRSHVFDLPEYRHAYSSVAARLSSSEAAQALALVDGDLFAKICVQLVRDLRLRTLVLVSDRSRIPDWSGQFASYLPDACVSVALYGELDRLDAHVTLICMEDMHRVVVQQGMLLDMFGMMVTPSLDEFDPIGWSRWVSISPSAKRVGSAKPGFRMDEGVRRLFAYHLGDSVCFANSPTIVPAIKRVRSTWSPSIGRVNPQFLSLEQVSSCLSSNVIYNGHLVEQIRLALSAGRNIVVFSDSVEHLRRIGCDLDGADPSSYDFAVHGVFGDSLVSACRAQVVLTTYSFCNNLPPMPEVDTVFLATPVENPSDAISVAMVMGVNKKQPIVVDMRCDVFPASRDAGAARDELYAKKYGDRSAA